MSEKKVIVAYVACFVIAAGVGLATDFPVWISAVSAGLLLLPILLIDLVVFRKRRSGRR